MDLHHYLTRPCASSEIRKKSHKSNVHRRATSDVHKRLTFDMHRRPLNRFVSWKIPIWNGWEPGVPLFKGTPKVIVVILWMAAKSCTTKKDGWNPIGNGMLTICHLSTGAGFRNHPTVVVQVLDIWKRKLDTYYEIWISMWLSIQNWKVYESI